MKKVSLVLLLTLTVSIATVAATEPITEDVPAPDQYDPTLPKTADIAVADRAAALRAQAQPLQMDHTAQILTTMDSSNAFVGVVRINPAMLARPVDPVVNADGSMFGFGLPRDMARLHLQIAGETYDLFFYDEKPDPKYGYRHVTLHVLNRDDAYARFSVDDRRGLVYGVIRTPARTIRIVPRPADAAQEVFVTSPMRTGVFASIPQDVWVDGPVSALIWRHYELEALAVIRPEHAESWLGTRSSYLLGGNLGTLRRVDAKSFVQLAARRRRSSGMSSPIFISRSTTVI